MTGKNPKSCHEVSRASLRQNSTRLELVSSLSATNSRRLELVSRLSRASFGEVVLMEFGSRLPRDKLETSSKLVVFKFHYSDFPETNSNEFVSSLSRTCLEFVSRKLETSRASFGVSNGQSSKPTRTNHLDMSRWFVRVSS